MVSAFLQMFALFDELTDQLIHTGCHLVWVFQESGCEQRVISQLLGHELGGILVRFHQLVEAVDDFVARVDLEGCLGGWHVLSHCLHHGAHLCVGCLLGCECCHRTVNESARGLDLVNALLEFFLEEFDKFFGFLFAQFFALGSDVVQIDFRTIG